MKKERFWQKSYPKGYSTDMPEIPYDNLVDFYDTYTDKFHDRIAFDSYGTQLNYQQVKAYSENIAAYLQQHSKPNANVAIMAPNCLQYPILVQAIHRAGMVSVNLNPLLTSYELSQVVIDSGLDTLFIWDGSADTLDELTEEASKIIKKVIVLSIFDHFPFAKRTFAKLLKNPASNYSLAAYDFVKYADIKENNLPFDASIGQQKPIDSLAFLQYTGGTTGSPKGVKLLHSNLLSNIAQVDSYLGDNISAEKKQNAITALPLYHIFALTANFLVMFRLGKKNILISDPRDIASFIKILRKNPPNIITGVNTLFNALIAHPDFHKVDFSHLVLSLGGGMSVRKETADKWKKTTGCFILEAYGLSETSPAATINPAHLSEYNGSIGLPIPGTDIIIADDEGNDLGIEKTGEILIKGPQVTPGYWNNDKETEQAFHNGWLKTGDVGKVDENGFFYILSRKKDMVVVSGFNVYPKQVEQVINSIDGIVESVCIGVPSERSGEALKVYIVADKHIDKEFIIAYCRKKLSAYKVPKLIEFVDSLPKSNVGKILRKNVRDIEAQAQND